MNKILNIIKIKLGMYEVKRYIHKFNPMYNLIAPLLKAKVKNTKGISLSELEEMEDLGNGQEYDPLWFQVEGYIPVEEIGIDPDDIKF